MIVEVTQEDIDWGTKADPKSCAVARAITRTCQRLVSVSPSYARVGTLEDQEPIEWYLLPDEAQEFIEDFDNDELVEPITFEMKKHEI